MNYIIWNGVNSETLPGLLISELPPITKPAQRVQVTEIEGRNGDITEKVGFAAYEKVVKIGLYGDFDVDKTAKFFTGSGEVTFSNESDKYYFAEITEQIDFERLIRFKTANVRFHTQPFKYKVNEQSVDVNITDQTEIKVTNQGLEPSMAVITIWGVGIIEISINGRPQFVVRINPGDGYITIDGMIQECYKDTPAMLKNRQMTGDWPELRPGENIITWSISEIPEVPGAEDNPGTPAIPGELTRIKIQPMSRWL